MQSLFFVIDIVIVWFCFVFQNYLYIFAKKTVTLNILL